MAAITICSDFGARKIKSATVSTVSPSICHEVMGPDAMILVFWMLSFKPTFPLSSFTFISLVQLCNPTDCSPPGSSVHGILQARILELVSISYSRGSSQLRDQAHISCVFCIGKQILYHEATWEAHYNQITEPNFLLKITIASWINAMCQ